jgi:hypothetical protein
MGWRVALAEVDGLVGVVGAWLLDSCGGGCVRALVHGGLHLLQELIDIHQIVLGSQVGHRWESILMCWHWACVTSMSTMAFDRDHRGSSRDIIGKTTSMDRNALELHQSLSNLSIRTRIDLAALRIPEEVIQSVVSAFSVVICGMMTDITSMADGIVGRVVRRRLLKGIIADVSLVMRRGILGSRARVHLRRMIVVTIGGSCKIMQVSNHCKLSSNVGVWRNNNL